jgi:hypothetical protein
VSCLARVGERKEILGPGLRSESDKTALAERLPREIGSFLEAFATLDPRQEKAHLQSILNAACTCNKGRMELEFREYGLASCNA